MPGAVKKVLAVAVVIIIICISYYFLFLREEAEDIKRAKNFSFYDSEEFMAVDQPVQKNLTDFRGSVVMLIFNDIHVAAASDQDNITASLKSNYTDVVFINIDVKGVGKNPTMVNNYKAEFGYDWYFTFDENVITGYYDVVFTPTIVIIDVDGYGTYKKEEFADYNELSAELDKTIAGEAEHINVGELPGKKAPTFSLKDINGRPLNLTDYRGKVVLLDFMSLTCTSCKQAEKVFKEIIGEYDEDEFVIISIDIDPTDTKEAIREHWENEGLTWRVVRDPGDLILKYNVGEIVHIVLIDKKGYPVYDHVGAPSKKELKEEIDLAIAGESEIIEITQISFYILAIALGIGTFFSPCSFPMLPGYMSYYLQKDLQIAVSAEKKEQTKEEKKKKKKKNLKRALTSGIVASFGIVLVFTIIGVLVLLAGTAIKPYISNIGPVVGVILLVLGGLMMTNLQYHRIIEPFQKAYGGISRKIKGESAEETVAVGEGSPEEESAGKYYAGMFSYGIGYGAAAAACTAPLFIAIVTQALLQFELFEGVIILFLYIISMVFLMIAVTVAIAMIGQSAVQKLAAYTDHIKKISGIVLILVGLYLIIFWYQAQ